jgi:chromosome segregation ATPase
MKKAAVISLILLLGISLGTSGYLLMNQKKTEVELGNVLEIVKTAGAGEKKLIKDRDAVLSVSSAKDVTITNLKEQLSALQDGVEQARLQVDQAKEDMLTAQAAAKAAINLLHVNKETWQAEMNEVQVKLASLEGQLADQGKQIEAKKKEIEKMQGALESYTKHGLTPAKILELSQKRPVNLKVSAFSGPKPKTPGKLRKPLLDPSHVNPANLTPATKSKLKENK